MVTRYDNRAPLYAQVKLHLRERIDGMRDGEFLPPEPDLCTEFGVSRITLRRAVKELGDEGLLIRQQGRGTVVARRKIEQTLVSLSGFADAMDGSGRAVRHRVLEVAGALDDAAAQGVLGPQSAGRQTRILRLITVDDQPLTLETLYLDTGPLAGIVALVAAGGSFFQALRQTGGPAPAAAERAINVGFATGDERRHLQVGPWQPVFRVDKTILAADGQPIAWSRLVTPANLVTYTTRS